MQKDKYISTYGISSEWLNQIFPFYLIISKENTILDMGPGFAWMQVSISKGDIPEAYFKPLYVFKKLTFEFIQNDCDDETIFKEKNDSFTLKGKSYFFSEPSQLLFCPSISVHDPEVAEKIKLQNFEPFDQTLDMIFLKAIQEADSKKNLNLIRALQKEAKELAEENKIITAGRVYLDGDKIKKLRNSHLMSMDMFVNKSQDSKCYISKSTIKRAEAGVKVYFRTALDIAKILQVNVKEILDLEKQDF